MTNKTTAAAAVLYFAIVFTIAFGLGVIRVLLLVPAVGEVLGTLIELPIMLTVSWRASAYVVSRRAVSPTPRPRLAMGIMAFAILMTAETLLGIFALGRPFADQIGAYLGLSVQIGLAGQIAFAAIPWIQGRMARNIPQAALSGVAASTTPTMPRMMPVSSKSFGV